MNRVANQRLYLTADRTRAVPEGDPGAAILLTAVAGDEVPVEYADLDIDPGFLQDNDAAPDETDEPDDVDTPADDATPPAPAAKPVAKRAAKATNKAVKKSANKSA